MVVLLAMAACGEQPTEPVSAVPERASALAPMPGSGTFTDGGLTYGYGCPISPCPVPTSVSSEISGGFYMWNPGKQTIYLYRIKVPVTVREIVPDIIIEPEQPDDVLRLPPELVGPNDLLDKRVNGLLTCTLSAQIIAPDNRVWNVLGMTSRTVLLDGTDMGLYAMTAQDIAELFAGTYRPTAVPKGFWITVYATLESEGDVHRVEYKALCRS
jgi:hypothetical protein